MPIGAAAWVGLATVAAGAYSANQQSRAGNRAAAGQQAAADRASAMQDAQYQQTRQDNMPLMGARNFALSEMMGGMGAQRPAQPFQRGQAFGQGSSRAGATLATMGAAPEAVGGAQAGPEAARGQQMLMAGGGWRGAQPGVGADGVGPSAGMGSGRAPASYGQVAQASGLPVDDLNAPSQGTTAQGDFNRDFTASDFRVDPGYQFRLDEGMRGIENSAAARGGALSGANLKDLTKYSQGVADQTYGDAYQRFNADRDRRFNRLSSLAGLGQTATANTQAMGERNAASRGEYGMQAANARAAAGINSANANTSALNNATNAYMQYSYGKQYGSGGGTYGGSGGNSGNGGNDGRPRGGY